MPARCCNWPRPATIYREPADAFVARFIGAAAVLAGVAEGAAVRVGHLALAAHAASAHAAGNPVEMFIRPEHVRLERMNGHVPPGAVGGEIRESIFFGSLTRVKLDLLDMPAELQGATGIWADLPSEQAEHFTPGSRVLARWDETSPRVLPRA